MFMSPQNPLRSNYTEDDLLFTEHNLDTKEDELQDKINTTHKEISNFFTDKIDPKNKFQKIEGLKGKPNLKHEEVEKNIEEKSIIYAPFNSSYTDYDEDHPELFDWPKEVLEML